jgi:hypothetical protein
MCHGESALEDEDGQRDHERHGGGRCKMPGRKLLETLRHESPQSAGRVSQYERRLSALPTKPAVMVGRQ